MLKPDQAIATFLTDDERAAWLRPGPTAADLGAEPGGWAWLLRHFGVTVTADVVHQKPVGYHLLCGFSQ